MKHFLCHSLLVLVLIVSGGCSALPLGGSAGPLPPVLAMEEVNRPYVSLGRITVKRTVNITDYAVPPNLQEWALQALREEAGKLDADALILPEISSREVSIVGLPAFPATEYRAVGVAIRFSR
ncbi:hypothetical protein [Trichlorobacter ammonificans]|uniref:Lipoprotein n=1 Tax=Trichlorobacter ammonificans TaxID=2916410 RepID=A0ABM9DBM0_9BACT|nr:hypothetical protein [Trichlorobacter ammonificans]CAH2032626.1 conserved exported protein of unknown function [Trichlorobacter ammonificans]